MCLSRQVGPDVKRTMAQSCGPGYWVAAVSGAVAGPVGTVRLGPVPPYRNSQTQTVLRKHGRCGTQVQLVAF